MKISTNNDIKLRSVQFALCAFFVLMLLGSVNAGFVRSYLTMSISIAEDGGANVREELRFYMDSPQSVDLYKVSLKATNNLAGWASRITLPDVRYHIDASNAQIMDVRIQPTSPDTCDYSQNTCYGTFVMEYKITPPTGEKGIVSMITGTKPRTISYLFNSRALLFETSLVAESYIPDMTTLEVKIPQGSRVVTVSPLPVEYSGADIVPSDATTFTWHGRLTISKFEIGYERKESLISEVTTFFTEMQNTVLTWLTSRDGITLVAVAIILIIGYAALQSKKSK